MSTQEDANQMMTTSAEVRASSNLEIAWSWTREAYQRVRAKLNIYSRRKIFEEIRSVLSSMGEDVYHQYQDSCFGHFLEIDTVGVSCNAAIHGVLSHEVRRADAGDHELWFRVGDRFIRFSRYEYALVTGLSFCPTTFDPSANHNPPETGLFYRYYQGKKLKMDRLRADFVKGMFVSSPNDAVRVAKMLTCVFFLFAHDGRATYIDDWMWTLIEDTDQWETFTWGRYTFEILLHYLGHIPMEKATYHVYGLVWAFSVWAYEAIPALGRTYGRPRQPAALPRMLRWSFPRGAGTTDLSHFFDDPLEVHSTLEPTADEQQQRYWEHIDDDMSSGIHYVRRDNPWKRKAVDGPSTLATATSRQRTAPRVGTFEGDPHETPPASPHTTHAEVAHTPPGSSSPQSPLPQSALPRSSPPRPSQSIVDDELLWAIQSIVREEMGFYMTGVERRTDEQTMMWQHIADILSDLVHVSRSPPPPPPHYSTPPSYPLRSLIPWFPAPPPPVSTPSPSSVFTLLSHIASPSSQAAPGQVVLPLRSSDPTPTAMTSAPAVPVQIGTALPRMSTLPPSAVGDSSPVVSVRVHQPSNTKSVFTMKMRIKDHKLPFNPHKLYTVFVDDDDVGIETLVTYKASIVKSWVRNIQYSNKCRLDRLIVGLDVEWHPSLTGGHDDPSVATLQLCVGKNCLVFQILHATRIPRRLEEFLGDPHYTFVGVEIKNDAERLWDDYDLEVENTRDLRSWAAIELGRKELRKSRLKGLVKEVVGVEMEERSDVTLSRWDNRELSRRQVGYACINAYFSFEIGRRLSAWY